MAIYTLYLFQHQIIPNRYTPADSLPLANRRFMKKLLVCTFLLSVGFTSGYVARD
jgi:hypothetical protein